MIFTPAHVGGMSTERPEGVHPEWCPDCGEEMLFSGTQPAGYAQFFCEQCYYRHDVYVGVSTVTETEPTGEAADPSESPASD
jgi:hypothetical protein